MADAKAAIGKEVAIPRYYFTEWAGQFENQERTIARLAIVVSLSILMIFFLLYSTFNSVKQGLLVLAISPTIGGISALWGRGLHLSVSAAIGFHRAVRHCRALS